MSENQQGATGGPLCKTCGERTATRVGRCGRCYLYQRQHGVERPVDLPPPRPPVMRGEDHPQWKGDAAHTSSMRRRARRRFALGSCERCGGKGTQRHHIDGYPGNNDPSNIMIVCLPCHAAIDDRAAKMRAKIKNRRPKLPPRPCINCGRFVTRFEGGQVCLACGSYRRRNGVDRPVDGIVGVTASCVICGKEFQKRSHHSMACGPACSLEVKRAGRRDWARRDWARRKQLGRA